MTNIGSIIGAIVLITFAGVCNGSWNASFSPRANLALGKDPTKDIVSYHHSFALFQIYAVLINIPICIYWAGGPQRVSAIISQTPPLSIVLIALFSFIWGIGTLCFGIACKVAGVGFGTNLSMGIVAILGALLPLITENTLFTPFGGVVCIGLIVCCGGLWLATKALAQRDVDEANAKMMMTMMNVDNDNDDNDDSNGHHEAKEFPLPSLENAGNNDENNDNNDDIDEEEETEKFNDKAENNLSPITNNDKNKEPTSPSTSSTKIKPKEYSTLQKVLVCLLTGITAVQLQFAFIFGKPITDLANNKDNTDNNTVPGETPFGGSAAIIWLFAISLGAPVTLIHGIISSPVPLSQSLMKAPWWRHLRIIVSTSIPWIAHIHIYGLSATSLFPEKVAASIAWPLLMMITNLWALVLSKILGEWKVACEDTIRTFLYSVTTTMVGLLILMCSVAVPTNK